MACPTKLGCTHPWPFTPSSIIASMLAVLTLFCLLPTFAQHEPPPKAPTDIQPGSITYEEVAYPYPVAYLAVTLYGQDLRMAYMDIPPAGQPNGRTVVLFHGMNFGGFYFAG